MRLLSQYKNPGNCRNFIKWNSYYLISKTLKICETKWSNLNDRTTNDRNYRWWSILRSPPNELFLKFYTWNGPFCMHLKISPLKIIFLLYPCHYRVNISVSIYHKFKCLRLLYETKFITGMRYITGSPGTRRIVIKMRFIYC